MKTISLEMAINLSEILAEKKIEPPKAGIWWGKPNFFNKAEYELFLNLKPSTVLHKGFTLQTERIGLENQKNIHSVGNYYAGDSYPAYTAGELLKWLPAAYFQQMGIRKYIDDKIGKHYDAFFSDNTKDRKYTHEEAEDALCGLIIELLTDGIIVGGGTKRMILYTYSNCPTCKVAKALLVELKLDFEEKDVENAENLAELHYEISRLRGDQKLPALVMNTGIIEDILTQGMLNGMAVVDYLEKRANMRRVRR